MIEPLASQCEHCNGAQIQRVKQIASNGAWQIFDRCASCGRPARKKSIFVSKYKAGDLYAIPTVTDFSQSSEPCVVCGASGTENHHWAPRHIFGLSEAEVWPQSPLCKRHHDEWHKRVTPDMTKGKSNG